MLENFFTSHSEAIDFISKCWFICTKNDDYIIITVTMATQQEHSCRLFTKLLPHWSELIHEINKSTMTITVMCVLALTKIDNDH